MDQQDIPDDVRRFVLIGIPSVPCMETLLLMRADPAAGWQKGIVARRVYIPEKEAADILAYLAEIGVAREEQPGSYRYAPAHEDLRATLDRVALAYSTHLVTVTNLIHSKGSKKAQHFANAFKWRNDR